MPNSKELIETIGYIKKFRDQIFIVKLSGDVAGDDVILRSVARDLILLNEVGIHPVVLHGAGSMISSHMKKSGLKPRFIGGERVTDKRAIGIVKWCLQEINDRIVDEINKLNKGCVIATGITCGLFSAKKKDGMGLVGRIDEINTKTISAIIKKGHIPVVLPIGEDKKGNSLNINADSAAGELARGLGATKLIVLTNVEGVYKNGKLIRKMNVQQAKKIIQDRVVTDGMIPKIDACINALSKGVSRVHIIKAGEHAILGEILTDEGTGTMITHK